MLFFFQGLLYPAETFWPVVAMLIFAVLLLVGILILLLLLRRWTTPLKVDKGTEAEPDDEKISLIDNEHLQRTITHVFKQLDEETSTERVLGLRKDTIEAREKSERAPILQWPVHDLTPLDSEPEFENDKPRVVTPRTMNAPYGILNESFLHGNLDSVSVSINVDTAEPMYSRASSKPGKILTSYPTPLPGSRYGATELPDGRWEQMETLDASDTDSEQDYSGWKSSSETSITAEVIRDDSQRSNVTSDEKMPEITEAVIEVDRLSGVLLLDSVLEEEERRADRESGSYMDGGMVRVVGAETEGGKAGDMDTHQVHVVGELPRPFKKEDEDNYVDHTFYTKIGPITIL